MGKPIGSDLAQGTLTLPAMLLVERFPEDNPVRRLFENREKDKENNIKEAIEIINNSSIVKECYQVAEEYCARACLNLKSLPDNTNRQALIQLADFVSQRNI